MNRKLKTGVSEQHKLRYLKVIQAIYERTKDKPTELTTEEKTEISKGIAVTVWNILVEEKYLKKIGRNVYFWESSTLPSKDVASACILRLRKNNREYEATRRKNKEELEKISSESDSIEFPEIEAIADEFPTAFKEVNSSGDIKEDDFPNTFPEILNESPFMTSEKIKKPTKKVTEEKRSILWGLYSYTKKIEE